MICSDLMKNLFVQPEVSAQRKPEKTKIFIASGKAYDLADGDTFSLCASDFPIRIEVFDLFLWLVFL